MRTERILSVPTGHILILSGERGKLECLSLGDYGKDVNIKASFLGLDRDLGAVKHQSMLPLEEKWVITVSTQYGCSMGCRFCDVPKVGTGRNATRQDMVDQFFAAFDLHPEVKSSKRVNLHYARMGEPTWNPDVLTSLFCINERLNAAEHNFKLHPVISTMMPKNNRRLEMFLRDWCDIKNDCYLGEAGLQLSINSTLDHERDVMFNGSALDLLDVSVIAGRLPMPRGRKYTLNFAVADYVIDAGELRQLFDPDKFMVKLTPMHKTDAALNNGITTEGDYSTLAPYRDTEAALKGAGFDVLVFVASPEEDLGRITCGNAILSGTLPLVEFTEVHP